MKKKYNLSIKKYNSIYSYWIKNKLFKPNINKNNKKNFSIIMPPPNITGCLHIGHAFQQTIMDVIIRYKKMSNYNTLWLMGTDHAGISTQIIVENYIKKKYNISKKISKKKIINEIWKWKKKYEKKIFQQTKLLGSSVDWSKTCFSLDKNFTKSVQKIFIYLYKKKLIYKSKKAIYWDYKIRSVLSDLEINKEKKILKKYFIKIKFLKNNNYLIIKTTKPELILGLTALATNNKNNKLIGKKLINPLTKNIIKIIYDKNIIFSKKNIYTKIIPGHKINNLIYCKKFNLDIINIYNLNRSFKKKIKVLNYKWKKKKKIDITKILKLKKLNFKYVKKKIINFLIKNKYILKIKNKKSNVYLSNKTNSKPIIIITNQWYLKTYPLAKKAIDLVKNKKITFLPSKYKKLFFKWMENIQDWCISRQIHWGHKIPIWYDKNNNIYIGKNKKEILLKYNIKKIKQDKNVLDTWFSSSIWPFTSLGWPKKNIFLKKFYPINLIVSGFDIIFFWISRMIMMSSYLSKKYTYLKIPFKKIFLTGLIRDENGNKMSKSIGNVIDPLDIIKGIKLNKLIKKRTKNIIKEKLINKIIKDTKKIFPNGIKSYGVDILRHTLCSISNSKLIINFDIKKLTHSYNYCNKIWNIYNFIFKYLNIKLHKKYKINKKKINLTEHWIFEKINILIIKFKKNLKKFRFDLINQIMFNFIKNIFSDWYIEIIKIKNKKNKISINNKLILIYIFKTILKLTHPITPFITEYLWMKISRKKKSILKEKFPKYKNYSNNYKKSKIFIKIKKIIIFIRKINKKNKKNIICLIILNLNLNFKKKIIKNKYLFELIKIYKIFFFKEKNFNKSNFKKNKIKILKKKKISNITIFYY